MPHASARRVAKYAAVAVGALLLLAAAALALVAAGAGSGLVKEGLARVMQEQKGRTLRIDELAWTLFPFTLRLDGAALSEPGSGQVFASLERGHASLQLLPLLRGELVIDSLELAGLRVGIRRFADGRLNIDDLLVRDPEAPPLRFHVGTLHLADAALAWRDEQAGQAFACGALSLDTGRLARAAEGRLSLSCRFAGEAPAVKGELRLDARYRYDLDAGRFEAPEAELRLAATEPALAARLALADFEATPESLQAGRAVLDLDWRRGATAVTARLGSALRLDFPGRTLELPALSGGIEAAGPRLPGKRLELPVAGSLRAGPAPGSFVARLETRLDGAPARADVRRAGPGPLAFQVDIDRLDADRYLPPQPAGQPPEPFDFAFLKDLDARGSVRVGRLRLAGVEARNVHLEVQAGEGRVAVTPR